MNPSILQTEQNLLQCQNLLRWQQIPFQPELRIWDRDIFTVNIPVPHAGLLESHLYIWYCSQECRV